MRHSTWIWGGLAAAMLAGLCGCETEEATGCIIQRRGADRVVSSISGDCSNKNLDGVDLSQARVEVYNWSNTICPDGTPSAQNNNTCAGRLSPNGGAGPNLGTPDQGEMPDLGAPDLGMPDQDVGAPDVPDPLMDMTDDEAPEDMREDTPPGPCMTPDECFSQCVLFDREQSPLSPVEITLPGGPWNVEFWVFLIRQDRNQEEVMTLFQGELDGEVLFTFDLELRDPGSRSDASLWAHAGAREEEPAYSRTLDTLDSNGWHHVAMDSNGKIFIDGSEAATSRGGGGPGALGPQEAITLRLGSSASGVGFYGSMREFYLKPGLLPSGRFTPVIVQDRPAQIEGLSWSLDPANGVPLMGNNDEPPWTLGEARIGPCPQRR